MAKMSERMKDLFKKVPTAVFATTDSNGMPNAVPVGAKRIIDSETILISDQFLNKTLANIKANPKAAVTYWEGREDISSRAQLLLRPRERDMKIPRNGLKSWATEPDFHSNRKEPLFSG
jgi:uncharacterized protein